MARLRFLTHESQGSCEMPQSYRLDDLGWYEFERLCQSLLKAACGLTIESWGGSGDHGRDAYCATPLAFPTKRNTQQGPFIFQAKFIQSANAAGARFEQRVKAAVDEELRRINNRRQQGMWDDPAHYILLTNAPLPAQLRRTLQQELDQALTGSAITCLGGRDIETMLDDNDRIRLSFPQVLGIRDLNALINAAVSRDVRTRSTITMSNAAQLALVFEPTKAYDEAVTVLRKSHFVVLTGPPEMGKTAIATILALAQHTRGWQAFECSDPRDFFSVYDKSEQQVLVADDAFGATEYRPEKAEAWAAEMHRILSRVDKSHWVIFTSRTAPLRRALDLLHFPQVNSIFPRPADVMVDAARLTVEEKARITYRHCKAMQFEDDIIRFVRANARRIVLAWHFTPLRIQRLANEQLPRIIRQPEEGRVDALKKAVHHGIEEPTPAMRTSFGALSLDQKRLLISMLSVPGDRLTEGQLNDAFRGLYASDPPASARLIADGLDGHFIRVTQELL